MLVGHSRKLQTVHFPLREGQKAEDLAGKLVDVKVDEAKSWYLEGTQTGDPR